MINDLCFCCKLHVIQHKRNLIFSQIETSSFIKCFHLENYICNYNDRIKVPFPEKISFSAFSPSHLFTREHCRSSRIVDVMCARANVIINYKLRILYAMTHGTFYAPFFSGKNYLAGFCELPFTVNAVQGFLLWWKYKETLTPFYANLCISPLPEHVSNLYLLFPWGFFIAYFIMRKVAFVKFEEHLGDRTWYIFFF